MNQTPFGVITNLAGPLGAAAQLLDLAFDDDERGLHLLDAVVGQAALAELDAQRPAADGG
jgi:hypothetical protein